MVLESGIYSQEEIQGNLGLIRAIPFLDDSIQIDGVPSYGEEFGPKSSKWKEYLIANMKIIAPKIQERVEAERNFKKI